MTAIALFFVILFAIGLLCIIAIVSAIIFRKALKLNPQNRKLEEIQNEIVNAQFVRDSLNEDINKLQGEKAETERIIAQKKEMEEFINSHQEEYDKKQKIIEELKDQIKELNGKLQKVANDHDEKVKELQELLSNISSKTLEYNALTERIARKSSELDDLKKEQKELEAQVKGLNDSISEKKAELERLKNSIQNKQEEIDGLKKEISNAEAIKSQLGVDVGQLKATYDNYEGRKKYEAERWEDLDRPISSARTKKGTSFDERKKLDEFEDVLSKSGIKFSQRTIYAFHTGLKAEDSSPLVVLAGISGTGKSLLPQLYSEAFGFNFLSVAVQPRWDSPQDMFGFYNYMQNRYKATELSRLLWQYDIYNNKNAKAKFNTEDDLPMNIVLLDEMNLARVEYYFSDMLSKLEIRRNSSSRSDAEIEIEGGSIGDKDASRRLFVNSNTLFVGTMNEDETTQSLSDKVMDRSNVLRFGKPQDLNATGNTNKFHASYSNMKDIYMPYREWKNICKEPSRLGQKQFDELEQIISEFNTEMAKIGRPYGFRLWRSILSYVSNYPVLDNNGFYKALADQIEMKILPKLNGLDKNAGDTMTALNNIGTLIQKSKDKNLLEVFNAVKDDGNTAFFQWKGVER